MEQRKYNFTLALFGDNPSTTSLFLRIIGLLSDASLSAVALCCQFRLAALSSRIIYSLHHRETNYLVVLSCVSNRVLLLHNDVLEGDTRSCQNDI